MAITGLKLRCPMEKTESLIYTSIAALTQGQLSSISDAVVVFVAAVLTADIGDLVTALTKAPKILLPCAAASTGEYSQGDKVYYDGAGNITSTASGNTLCGHCIEASSTGDTEVLINFDGTLSMVA